jgi:hypothetical protein
MPVAAMVFRLQDMERKLLRLALSPPRMAARSRLRDKADQCPANPWGGEEHDRECAGE